MEPRSTRTQLLCSAVLLGLYTVATQARRWEEEEIVAAYLTCIDTLNRNGSRDTGCWSDRECWRLGPFYKCNRDRCACECAQRDGEFRIYEIEGACHIGEIIRQEDEHCHRNDQCNTEGAQECVGKRCGCPDGYGWSVVLEKCLSLVEYCSDDVYCVHGDVFDICNKTWNWNESKCDGSIWQQTEHGPCGLFSGIRLQSGLKNAYFRYENSTDAKSGPEPKSQQQTTLSQCLCWILAIVAGILLLAYVIRKLGKYRTRRIPPTITASTTASQPSPAIEVQPNTAPIQDPTLLPQNNPRQMASQIAHVKRAEFITFMNHILGRGKGGIVYKGQFGAITVAVKALNPGGRRVDMYMDSLDREIEIFNLLPAHPNIIKLLAYCVSEATRFLLLEFCELGCLGEFLVRNTFQNSPGYVGAPNPGPFVYTYQNLLDFALQIATGAEFLAEHRVVHGDLACRNVLLALVDTNWVAKITDFGLAHKLDDDSPTYIQTTNGLKPWKWSAPEVLNGNTFSIQSDVWSFGVTLWEIFSLGVEPYKGLQYPEFCQGFHRLARPNFAPVQLYRLMKECWQSQPEHRIGFTELKMEIIHLSHVGNENGPQMNPPPDEAEAD